MGIRASCFVGDNALQLNSAVNFKALSFAFLRFPARNPERALARRRYFDPGVARSQIQIYFRFRSGVDQALQHPVCIQVTFFDFFRSVTGPFLVAQFNLADMKLHLSEAATQLPDRVTHWSG